ncbi:MAG: SDR family NAD(P)-dependent oxidoreductase [Caldilineales bacterium]|nr:SDR family NAD(P)-dependent oxidoreductase [Caldilineales bacterium]
MPSARLIKQQPFRRKIALIPGGSKGIGKASAREIVQLGGSVGIVARDPKVLQETADELESLRTSDEQFIDVIACDVTDEMRLLGELASFLNLRGLPDYLINMVGYAYPQYCEQLTLADFRRNMEVNYFGQLIPIMILLPHFMEARRGHIVNASSGLGFMGAMGYATYTPTKYAIFGLSESLRNELKPYGVRVSVVFPPDTDTPGFETENITKPQEIHLMQDGFLRTYTAAEVAEEFIVGLLKNKFEIHIGAMKYLRIVSRISPGLVRYVSDREYQQARRKLGKA